MSILRRLHFIIILATFSLPTLASADQIADLERQVGENKHQVSLAYNKYLAAQKKLEASQKKLDKAKSGQATPSSSKRFNKNR